MPFEVSVEEQPRRVVVYRNVTCDRCGKCPPAMSGIDAVADGSLQYDNVLVLRFTGGYGMFCDPEPLPRHGAREYDPEFDRVLCHECAHELCDFLGIDPSNWHTHVPASAGGTQHEDHHHWDEPAAASDGPPPT